MSSSRERNNAKVLLLAAFCAYCSLCVFDRTALAQEDAPLAVQDVVKADRFGQLMPIAVSPDGRFVAYTVQERQRARAISSEMYLNSGVPPWASGTDIYLLRISTGEARKLTDGESDNWLPTWSPDGRCLAFLSDRDGGNAGLWEWDAAADQLKKVSNVEVRSEQIEWTPDGRAILVTGVTRDRAPQNAGGKASWSGGQDELKGRSATRPTVVVYESTQASIKNKEASSSDPWDLDMALRDLVSVDPRTGKVAKLVDDRRIATYRLSPDGLRVAYTVPKRFERPGSQQIIFDLEVIEISAAGRKTIASDVRMDYDGSSFSWSPDSAHVSFRTGGMEEPSSDCYVVDLNMRATGNLAAFRSASVASSQDPSRTLWDRESERIYFVRDGALWRASVGRNGAELVSQIPDRRITQLIDRKDGLLWTVERGQSTIVVTHDDVLKQDGFYRIDLQTGASEKVLERGECYTCANVKEKFMVTGDGERVLYFSESAAEDQDLWLASSAFKAPRRLTRLNPQFGIDQMGAARVVDWLSDDGVRLHGALLLPRNYREGREYPLVVWVYGGALLSNQVNRFGLGYGGPFNLQLLATRGYAVLLPDAPLSVGTPMLDLAKTVLPGVNKVIEMGIADPNRVGVIGHSYGGYSVLALIAQTPRFRAAIAAGGYGDLVGHYGEMGRDGTAFGVAIEEHGQGRMGGPPWDFPLRFIENSPVFHLERIATPLLIIHGGKDEEIRPFLGEELFVGLRRLGKPAELARYEEEGHSPTEWSLANQVDFSNRMISWLDAHLKGEGQK